MFFMVFQHRQSQVGDDLTTLMSSGLTLLKHTNSNLHGLRSQSLKLVGIRFKVGLDGNLKKKDYELCGHYWPPFCLISYLWSYSKDLNCLMTRG